ncbi:pentapeptide repeat-containing protein [Cellulomonas carbonis]|uniref:Pentapeptide repeat-containing protein n=1 Tax=Cellulomonas carbonis T26 TaxID=947969 RepID=A0A0A0BTR9_9CELL|nr:pentapeptide repeat-containing protein [Cellulomonas carbonis]KGM11311.1 hypothetical protein N868_11180 [Cellulomonas carbonis T26]GGC00830.1 hypothetical protein GCM10010972_12010 [Cellulomonas carbonis]
MSASPSSSTGHGTGAGTGPGTGAGAPPHLVADCSRCAGLCCVALPFARSADFAVDKPAGVPCTNLRDDFRCGVHDRLRETGWVGCTVFDCAGAGQHVVQDLYGGRDWRSHPELADEMFAVFAVVRQLHEMLWHLDEAARRAPSSLVAEVSDATARTVALTSAPPDALRALDVAAHRSTVGPVLRRVSAVVRSVAAVRSRAPRGSRRAARDYSSADLIGAPLRGADLRGVDLCGAYLLGADLRDARLDEADLLGADLRGADVRGADLAGALYVTTMQVAAARGDARTTLPSRVPRPGSWGAAGPVPLPAPRRR